MLSLPDKNGGEEKKLCYHDISPTYTMCVFQTKEKKKK
jgi:hypothetical protein